jgi:tetratricopeptide (TPR) repeat protein
VAAPSVLFPQKVQVVTRKNRPSFKLVAFLFLLGTSPAWVGQNPSDVANSIAMALRGKDYEQAVRLAESALQKSPGDPRILTMKGIALSGLGKNHEALAAYDGALKSAPNYLPALEGAAQIEYNSGSDRAAALLNRILQIQPDNLTSHAMLGAIAYKHRDCKGAIEHFRASGELLSSQPAALGQYGFCLMQTGHAADAVPVYADLVSAAPRDTRARISLAAAQLLADQPRDALATLDPILQESDPDAEALDIASNASEKIGDTPRAVELLRKAILRAPDDPTYYVDFATLAFDHSSFDVGIDVLNAGLQRLPKSASLYLARGILYIQRGQYDKGAADFETAQRLDPRQAFSSESESLAKIQQTGGGQALPTVRSRLKEHPNDPVLLYLLADTLTRNGAQPGSAEFREALSADTRAVERRPDLILARDLLSSLYFKQGDFNKSIEQCRLALRADPTDQEALYRLTQALRKTGKTAEIPPLLKHLAELREEERKKENTQNRYKLVEPRSGTPQPAPR